MTGLDRVIPTPALLEIDDIDLAIPPSRAWEVLRHGDLGDSPLVRALFAVRTLPERLAHKAGGKLTLRIDELKSSTTHPGFHVLVDDPSREVVAFAIGKVWHLEIPFVHTEGAEAFRSFSEPGFVKVAWALRITPRGEHDTHVEIELRVDATDRESWSKFRRYFALVGPVSQFIRRSLLSSLARKYGTPSLQEEKRSLPGDELLPDAGGQITHGVTIAARPDAIWPWLLQMGCGRAGFYSIDALDNDGVRSAREVHPELQRLRVGDVLPATPDSEDGFEVLAIEPGRALVLGSLYDADAKRQRRFDAERPERFWQITWSFVLEALDERSTRLHVRARAAFPTSGRLHAEWIRPVHHFMQTAQLRHLAARIEHRGPRDDARDIAEGLGGAAVMIAALLTPFLREARNHWGVDAETAARALPGDELVAAPRWSWTHGIEIDAPPGEVWPWIAQLGADRGGFYSYQWLENVVGCEVRNAERIHSEWAIAVGDALLLHPKMPPLHVAALDQGHFFVVHAAADARARATGKPCADVSWLFLVEPLGEGRSRLVSRYRCAMSDDLATRLSFGPTLLEPIGFAMDRRMLLGVKARVEARRAKRPLRSLVRRGECSKKVEMR
ncbi:MAG: hypothetical protein JWP87_6307 [Labilithrix sp.]|nr:hypothetical protein [Labilithrix sp.]